MLEIQKMITLSTAHITEQTAKLLDKEPEKNNMTISVYKKSEYGWFLPIESIDYNTAAIPEDLKKVIAFAKDHGCSWLCLDCDGPILDYLDTYKW